MMKTGLCNEQIPCACEFKKKYYSFKFLKAYIFVQIAK